MGGFLNMYRGELEVVDCIEAKLETEEVDEFKCKVGRNLGRELLLSIELFRVLLPEDIEGATNADIGGVRTDAGTLLLCDEAGREGRLEDLVPKDEVAPWCLGECSCGEGRGVENLCVRLRDEGCLFSCGSWTAG